MDNNVTVLIWDSIEPVPDSKESKVLWQSYTVKDPRNEVSVLQMIEENADEFRDKYLSFIYDIGCIETKGKRIVDHLEISSGFSFWWTTLLVEQCNYSKSPYINDIIKLMVFEKWLDNRKPIVVKIASTNKKLVESVKILTKQLGVLFECIALPSRKPTETFAVKVYDRLPDVLKALVSISSYLLDHWKLKGVGLNNWKKSSSKITFISYFFNIDTVAAKQGVFKDKYWTKLPGLLEKNEIESNWLHHYVKSESFPRAKSVKELIDRFYLQHRGRQNHLFLDSFLSFKVVGRSIFGWLNMLFKYYEIKSEIKQQSEHFWPLIETDLKSSLIGTAAIHNMLFYHLFRRALNILPPQKKGFYLQENQGWEFGFINAWREFSHGQLIGIPHSTVRYWDLRYFFDDRNYKIDGRCRLPLPDKIGVNGKNSKNNYIRGKYPKGDLINLEALRYLQLEYRYSNKNKIEYSGGDVLVLGDYSPKYTKQQMLLLQKTCRLLNDKVKINFIVKPHPMCPINSKDYPAVNMVVTDKPIHKIIDDCVFVYVSSMTSAAVDAYCAGKYVVTVLDQSTLNLSPLRGYKECGFVNSPVELADIIRNFNRYEISEDQGKGYFCLDTDIPRWRKLILDETIKN